MGRVRTPLRARRSISGTGGPGAGGVSRLALSVLFGLGLVVGPTSLLQGAAAYQVPDTDASIAGGVATATMPGSGLVTEYSGTGFTSVDSNSTLGERGYVAGDHANGLPSSTPAVQIRSATGDCPPVGPCPGRGTLTITFSQPVRNPVLNIAGIGGGAGSQAGTVKSASQLHAILSLATPGVTLSKASGGNLSVEGGTTITAANDNTATRCDNTDGPLDLQAEATAACGQVQVNGTVTSLTFVVSAVFSQTPGSTAPVNTPGSGDVYALVASAPEDFGDAPATYDQGDAARAVLSDVTLGGGVTEDNALVPNGTASPNAGPGASADGQDDGVTLAPLPVDATSHTTTVDVSGASKAGTVCGWIDTDKNGTFDSPAERACAAFAAGDTSATLTWNGLSGLTPGDTYARFRIGYDDAQTQSPTGASDSGEVEDYPLTIATPMIELVKTASPDRVRQAGEVITYTFTATNTGITTLNDVTIAETEFSGSGSMSALDCTPAQPTTLAPDEELVCTATYEVTQADMDAGEITNAATACAGTAPCDDDDVAVPTSGQPALSLDKRASKVTDENGNGRTDAGDEIAYEFEVENTGNVTLSGITVNDEMLEEAGITVTCDPDTLAPGESVVCTADARYVITRADAKAGSVTNVATACADQGPCDEDSTETETDPAGPGNQPDGALPDTGLSASTMAAGIAGLLAIALGCAMVAAARRRERHGH